MPYEMESQHVSPRSVASPNGCGSSSVGPRVQGPLIDRDHNYPWLTGEFIKVFEDFGVRKKVEKWKFSDKFGRISG